jgi:hypothetical protein
MESEELEYTYLSVHQEREKPVAKGGEVDGFLAVGDDLGEHRGNLGLKVAEGCGIGDWERNIFNSIIVQIIDICS